MHDAGIKPADMERIVFVGGPTRMPVVRGFFEEMFGRKAEMGVDPMECVAAGAAIQAGVLAGEVGGIVLVDVTPLTLGVETLGGIATPLIARNTPIPVKRSETFTTAADMQTSVTIHVFQGERPMSADNTSLGEFNLDGLPPAPRGMPKIEVTFDIDCQRHPQRLRARHCQRQIAVDPHHRLDPLAEGRKEAHGGGGRALCRADKKRREDAEKLNAADAVCYEAEKTLANFGANAEDMRKRMDSALRDTREAVKKRDAALATERAEKLTARAEGGRRDHLRESPEAPKAGVFGSAPKAKRSTSGSARGA